jgi:hypothetical protein
MNIEDKDEDNSNCKKILITEAITKSQSKKINCEKAKKLRVETETWGLCEEDLSHDLQTNFLTTIYNGLIENKKTRNKYCTLISGHIKAKLCAYKQQDLLKKIYNPEEFVNYHEVISLLNDCKLKCHYCACEIFLLYQFVREKKQWSLDRINNDIGHNNGNLVIACLECNLKRRRTNKDAFMFTKNMKIIREGIK